MIVYHYSPTLRAGDRLDPGHQHLLTLCEPFVQALSYSRDCFYGMLFNGKYMFAVMDRSHLREWADYGKWATEGVFEYVRKKEFPRCVSRLQCTYFCTDLDDVRRMYMEDWGEEEEAERAKVHLFEVEVDADRLERRDIALFDAAYDAIHDAQDLDAALRYARLYYQGECLADPNWEYLSDEKALAVRDVTHLLKA